MNCQIVTPLDSSYNLNHCTRTSYSTQIDPFPPSLFELDEPPTPQTIRIDLAGKYLSSFAHLLPTTSALLDVPTGAGKTTYYARQPRTVIFTSLATTVKQVSEAEGIIGFAPSIGTNDGASYEGRLYFTQNTLIATHASWRVVVEALEGQGDDLSQYTFVIDELHSGTLDSYSQLNELLSYLYERNYKVIGMTGTLDLMPSHPVWAGVPTVKATNGKSTNCFTITADRAHSMSHCAKALLSADSASRSFVFLNDKGTLLDTFLEMIKGARRPILTVSADSKDVFFDSLHSLASGYIVVCTAVLREGVSLYGEYDGIYLLSHALPAAMQQISQRVRAGACVYWYRGEQKTEKWIANAIELGSEIERLQTALLVRAHWIIDGARRGINVESLVYDDDIRLVTDEYAINHCAIDHLAYRRAVASASHSAIEQWLTNTWNWHFSPILPDGVLVPVDDEAIAERAEASQEKRRALLATIATDGENATRYDAKTRRATSERGLEWKGLAHLVIQVSDALGGGMWAQACHIVGDCEGKGAKIRAAIDIIERYHDREKSTVWAGIASLADGKDKTGRELAIAYCHAMIDVWASGGQIGKVAHFYGMIDKVEAGDGATVRECLKHVKRVLAIRPVRQRGQGGQGGQGVARLYHVDGLAYDALIHINDDLFIESGNLCGSESKEHEPAVFFDSLLPNALPRTGEETSQKKGQGGEL